MSSKLKISDLKSRLDIIENIEKALNINFEDFQLKFLLFNESVVDWGRGKGKTLCSAIKVLIETNVKEIVYIRKSNIFVEKNSKEFIHFSYYDISLKLRGVNWFDRQEIQNKLFILKILEDLERGGFPVKVSVVGEMKDV